MPSAVIAEVIPVRNDVCSRPASSSSRMLRTSVSIDLRHNLAKRTGGGAGIARASNGDEKTRCLIGQRNVDALGVRSIARAEPEVRHHANDLSPRCWLAWHRPDSSLRRRPRGDRPPNQLSTNG